MALAKFLKNMGYIFLGVIVWIFKYIGQVYTALGINFVVRSYLFGGISYMVILLVMREVGQVPISIQFYLLINFLLFPFGKFMWEEIANIFLRNKIFIAPVLLLGLWGIFKYSLLIIFSVILFPFSLVNLYFSSK